MAKKSPASALRQLQLARSGLRKARMALRLLRENSRSGALDPRLAQSTLHQGWIALSQALRILSEIPWEAIDDPVLTKQLAVQRYATALLVRLRRLARGDWDPAEDGGDEDWGDDADTEILADGESDGEGDDE